MYELGRIYDVRKEHEQAVEWFTKGAETGLPLAKFFLGCYLDLGEGVSAADYSAAADWWRRAADAGSGEAANNLASVYKRGRGWAWQDACHVIPPHFSPAVLELVGNT